jgi:hypothetical protein
LLSSGLNQRFEAFQGAAVAVDEAEVSQSCHELSAVCPGQQSLTIAEIAIDASRNTLLQTLEEISE